MLRHDENEDVPLRRGHHEASLPGTSYDADFIHFDEQDAEVTELREAQLQAARAVAMELGIRAALVVALDMSDQNKKAPAQIRQRRLSVQVAALGVFLGFMKASRAAELLGVACSTITREVEALAARIRTAQTKSDIIPL